MNTKVVVAYVEHPSSACRRALRRVFDQEPSSHRLPMVSTPMSPERAKEHADMLAPLLHAPGEAVMVQPAVLSKQITESEACAALQQSSDWVTLVDEHGTRLLDVAWSHHERHWRADVRIAGAQIPPGIVFLVDQWSSGVFPRRWID